MLDNHSDVSRPRPRRRPAEPPALAAAVAGALVTTTDPGAQAANIWYWDRAQPMFAALTDAIAANPDGRLRAAAADLRRTPTDPGAYRRLHALVAATLRASPEQIEPVVDAAWAVLTRSRMSHHLGSDYQPGLELGLTALAARAGAGPGAATAPRPGADPEILVVIPFRDRGEDGHRARNLLACLLALRDQTLSPDRYRVVLVESDDRPRWRELLAPYVDEYLFAPKAGIFNKWWTINVGVRNATGRAELICILDADALVDADFLARNLGRFDQPETGAFLPYRNLFFLDAAASAWAIDQRCQRGEADVAASGLRGFLIHRAQGVCLWLRRDIFDDIGGMDERYEGWGKADMDLLLRLMLATALFQYEDPMLHLYHPPSYRLSGNAHIPWLSYVPAPAIGQLDRYAEAPVG
ncbi:MAG TPA: glycosyltransferase [Mycobacteriales bacterium]|nr:glycosyltransferase [Mycobacteriales bacterium]